MKNILLGKGAPLNLERLIETRLLLQANSGGGKSWALRRILEQTHGQIQQIVIDVEDEFQTLREHFDYILAGGHDGDCPADVKSAALLARRLLELNVSAIIGIYELKAHDRVRFVRLFLESLVNAPKELWHPALVVLDEAHIFCPQQGEAESTEAVKDLMTRGRKRGFCGILATQRISKLHKDAAAEANNKLIGRSALDVDMKRAGDELGFTSREDQAGLRTLKPGEFFCFGPALSDTVTRIKVGDIRTTHPKMGQHTAPPAPPREKVRAILAKLADLPKVAAEEAQTVSSLQIKVRELERQLRTAPVPLKAPEPKTVRVEFPILKDSQVEKIAKAADRLGEVREKTNDAHAKLCAMIGEAVQMMKTASQKYANVKPVHPVVARVIEKRPVHTLENLAMKVGGETPLSKAERLMLTALAQYPQGRTKAQIGVLSGYSSSSGTFSTYIGALRSKGFIDGRGDSIQITEAGREALGHFDPLPTGEALQSYWMNRLLRGEAAILKAVLSVYPNSITREEIGATSGYSHNSGTFSTYLGKLRTLELVTGRGDEIKASPDLVEL